MCPACDDQATNDADDETLGDALRRVRRVYFSTPDAGDAASEVGAEPRADEANPAPSVLKDRAP